MSAYRTVWKVTSPDEASAIIQEGPLVIQYRPYVFVTSPAVDIGYGLFAFDRYENAKRFSRSGTLHIWRALGYGPMPVPIACSLDGLEFGHFIKVADIWPQGTLCFRWLMLQERVDV